jgi:hypothetical protein
LLGVLDLEPDINDLSRMTELGLLAAERGDDEEDGE